MLSQSFTLEPQPDYSLYITAKRYWVPALESHADDPDALTLIFLHATSFHKETWEPTMERLFYLASSRGSSLKIREAWALDCPNHGESAMLNERALQQPEFLFNCSFLAVPVCLSNFLLVCPIHTHSYLRKVCSRRPPLSFCRSRSRSLCRL